MDIDAGTARVIVDIAIPPKVDGLTPGTLKGVLWAISSIALPGKPLFPRVETIAERACCGLRTTKRALAELREAGVLVAEARYSEKGRTSNLLTIDYERLAEWGAVDLSDVRKRRAGRCQGGTTGVPARHDRGASEAPQGCQGGTLSKGRSAKPSAKGSATLNQEARAGVPRGTRPASDGIHARGLDLGDGPATTLRKIGVDGDARVKLSAEFTTEQIIEAWRGVNAEPGVKSPVGLLIDRLCKASGVQIGHYAGVVGEVVDADRRLRDLRKAAGVTA